MKEIVSRVIYNGTSLSLNKTLIFVNISVVGVVSETFVCQPYKPCCENFYVTYYFSSNFALERQ